MRRRFQFSLRAFLIGVIPLSAVFSWIAHDAIIVRKRLEMMNSEDRWWFISAKQLDEAVDVSWLRWQLGDTAIMIIGCEPAAANTSKLAEAAELFPEAEIWVADSIWRSPQITLGRPWIQRAGALPYIEQQEPPGGKRGSGPAGGR